MYRGTLRRCKPHLMSMEAGLGACGCGDGGHSSTQADLQKVSAASGRDSGSSVQMRLLSMIVRSRWDGGIDLAHRNKEVSAMAKDPVCAMEVNDQTAKWTSTYVGKRYSFCSAGCKESFDKDPDRYLLESDLLGRKIKPQ